MWFFRVFFFHLSIVVSDQIAEARLKWVYQIFTFLDEIKRKKKLCVAHELAKQKRDVDRTEKKVTQICFEFLFFFGFSRVFILRIDITTPIRRAFLGINSVYLNLNESFFFCFVRCKLFTKKQFQNCFIVVFTNIILQHILGNKHVFR